MLRDRLIRLLGGHLTPPDHGEPQHSLGALAARLDALEALQLKRELEWAEVQEKVLRYLKRVATIEQRASERAEGATADPVQLAVLRSKYPPKQAGG